MSTEENAVFVYGAVRMPLDSEAAYTQLEQIIAFGKQYHSAQQQLNGVQQKLDGARDQFQKAVQKMAAASVPNTLSAAAPSGKKVTRGRKHLPAVGARSIDYLLRVAATSQDAQPLGELFPRMQASGWQTTSVKARAIINNLSSVCRKHADLVHMEKERVTLTEAGRTFVETLPPLEAIAATE